MTAPYKRGAVKSSRRIKPAALDIASTAPVSAEAAAPARKRPRRAKPATPDIASTAPAPAEVEAEAAAPAKRTRHTIDASASAAATDGKPFIPGGKRTAVSMKAILEDGGTFRIEAVSAPFPRAEFSGKLARHVDIAFEGRNGPVHRRVTFNESGSADRSKLLAQIARDRAANMGLSARYKLAGSANGNDNYSPCLIIPHDGPDILTGFEEVAQNHDFLQSPQAAKFQTASYPLEPICPGSGKDFYRGGILVPEIGEVPVTLLVTNTSNGFAVKQIVQAHIHVRTLLREQDKPQAKTEREIEIVHRNGTAEIRKGDLSRLKSSDFVDNAFAMDIPANSSQELQKDWPALYAALTAEPGVKTAELAGSLGWQVKLNSLAWLAADCVHDVSGSREFFDFGIYPPEGIEPECTQLGLSDIATSQIETAMSLLLRELNSQCKTTLAAFLGFHTRLMQPFACVDAMKGKAPFLFEICGDSGNGKTPLISNFACLHGTGYPINIQTKNNPEKDSGNTNVGKYINLTTMPFLPIVGPDLKLRDHGEDLILKTRKEFAEKFADNRISKIGSRTNKLGVRRDEITGGVIIAVEADMASKAIAAFGPSSEFRTITVMLNNPSVSEIGAKLSDKSMRNAISAFGFQYRAWIMRHFLAGDMEDMFLEADKISREICFAAMPVGPEAECKFHNRHARNAVYLVTGLFLTQKFVSEVFPQSFMMDWITSAIPELIEDRRSRAEFLTRGIAQKKADDDGDMMIRVFQNTLKDGTGYVKSSNPAVIENLGYPANTFGSPKKGFRMGEHVKKTDGDFIAIQPDDVSIGGIIHREVLKVYKSYGLQIPDVKAWFDARTVKDREGKNPAIQLDGCKPKRLLKIPLDKLFPPIEIETNAPANTNDVPATTTSSNEAANGSGASGNVAVDKRRVSLQTLANGGSTIPTGEPVH